MYLGPQAPESICHSAEARRLLPSIKDEGLAKILKRRCTLVETIQELCHTKDLRVFEPDELRKRFQLIKLDPEGANLEPTDSLKLKVLVTAAHAQAKKMVASKLDSDIAAFLEMVVPFSAESKGFDYFAPTMVDTVLEALSRTDTTAASWGMLAKEELEDLKEPVPVNWEAVSHYVTMLYYTTILYILFLIVTI